MTTKNVLFDCAAFRVNPGTDAAIKTARIAMAKAEKKAIVGLTLLAVALVGFSHLGNILGSSGLDPFSLFVALTVVGGMVLLEAAADAWLARRPDFKPVYDELTALGRDLLGLEPKQLAALDIQALQEKADGAVVSLAAEHLELERQLDNDLGKLTAHLLVLLAAQARAASKNRIATAYERLVAAGFIIRRDRGYGHHFAALRRRPS